MSCFWVAALLLALHSAAAVGPGSDMDSWMSSMIAKAPKVAKFNSTPSTLAYITTTKVTACSFSSSYATAGGSSATSNLMKARTFNLAASTCADAVSDAFADSCKGSNVISRISTASTTCGNAMAGVFVQQLSAATSTDNARACSMGCAFAETGGAAVASAAGDAILSVLGNCGAVSGWMKSGQLAASFVDITTKAFSHACTFGKGSAHNQGVILSKTIAQSLSKVLTQVVGQACSCKQSCNCPPLPVGLEYEDQAFSESVGKVVSGQFAAQQTVADAAGLLCDGKSVQSAAKKVLEVTTKTIVDGLQVMNMDSKSDGKFASACGIMYNKQAAFSLAMASSQVLANAFELNFNKTCGGIGFAAVTGLAKSSDAALWMVDRLSVNCNLNGRNFTRSLVNDIVKDSPYGNAVHDSLQGVVNTCGCKERCWCGTPSATCKPQLTCPAYQLGDAEVEVSSSGSSRKLRFV
ncbi:hypothetical protein OEZ85_000688 [Tetradesmus obliquus]|uniref:Uncharacterized protein n=1 Tax=Tetradesmus obliquus TaxID=3088 RepID=A0ABY8UPE1_TETOB|nr:hypothetical protein OEZ85_000688 [Tetradesmus obliquus]